MTTRLSPTGQFNIYNLAGSVNVFVDINGYYVDHNHDDRYDTTAEVDAKIAAVEAKVAPTTMSRSMYEMFPTEEMTDWNRLVVYTHTTSSSTECLTVPFDPVAGQKLIKASVAFLNQGASPQELDVYFNGLRTEPGPFSGSGDLFYEVGSIEGDVATAAPTAIYERSIVIDGDPVIKDGFRYSMLICTDGMIVISGATIELE